MAAPGYVLKNRRTTLERAEKFISCSEFTDVNLWGRLYPKKAPVKSIVHYAAPDRVTFAEAAKGTYVAAKVGDSFGPTWSTHWFQVEVAVPEEWEGEEVCLLWNSESEAMVWLDGEPQQGLTPENKRCEYFLSRKLTKAQLSHTLHIEMACNELFGAGRGSQIGPTIPDKYFCLKQVELAVRDRYAYQLYMDLDVLVSFIQNAGENDNRGMQALYTVNDMINLASDHTRTAYQQAHEMALQFFAFKNGQSQHVIHASGHCHIDTAWLWPYAETIRKCARSWSSTIRLMEEYPDLTFSCSQAQQFECLSEHYPGLFKKIKQYVDAGRFIPVGGTYVEMDGNVPSGEGFVRQFYYGQKYFEKEFGSRCKEFWLPDTFGYSGNLPQIMKLSGIDRFLTQKLSWNLVNTFPHHTFWWEGIDGSGVLTHFPPGDNYGMRGTPKELLFTLKNFKDKGRSNSSMFLFGYGDGGQGPTASMVERLQRLKDMDGCPKVLMSSPDNFFSHVEAHDEHRLCHWRGELFFELHNATYTTQAKTKKGNRKCEFALQQAEIASTIAYVLYGTSYPTEELDRLWKLLLLNQFHDVLPGTSINLVYRDAAGHYKDIRSCAKNLFSNAANTVCEKVHDMYQYSDVGKTLLFNPLSWSRVEVIVLPELAPAEKKTRFNEDCIQVDSNGHSLVAVKVDSFGYSEVSMLHRLPNPVTAEKGPQDCILLSNEHLDVKIDPLGRIESIKVDGCDRNAVASDQLANQFVIFDDIPLYWDAWDVMDYHLETRKTIDTVMERARIIDSGPLRATVQVSLKISDQSYLKQELTLDYGCPYLKCHTEVVWHESHKFLKVEFPVSVLAQQATYDIQFGHLQRPTHFNTSWDWAKFEVCGHKWADLSEYDFGVAVLNDCKYGWSCINNVLRLSLLRSSKAPDDKADMGSHNFTYAIMPHTGSFQEAGVIQAAYSLNCPLMPVELPGKKNFVDKPSKAADQGTSRVELSSFMSIDNPAVICETLKVADHGQFPNSLPVVMRFYEAFGSHATAKVVISLPLEQPQLCNLLEEPEEDSDLLYEDGILTLHFKPFQVLSVMFQKQTAS